MVIAPELSLHADEGFGAPRPRTGPDVASVAPLRVARRDAAEAFERSYLESISKRTSGNVTRAAAIAEVSRQMTQKLMRKHELP
jgi:DNA-binding NtrC family response regulator